MNELYAVLTEYGYGTDPEVIDKITVKAPDLERCFYKLLDVCEMYGPDEVISSLEHNLERKLEPQDLVNYILEINGDGCDYIFYLELDDKVYIDDDYIPDGDEEYFLNYIWNDEDEEEYKVNR